LSARPKAPEWYFFKAGSRTGQQAGPFSWEQLRSLAQAGTLEPADVVWSPQLSQWLLAAQIPDLFPAVAVPGVQGTYPGPPQPGASATTRGHSWLPWLVPLVALIIVGGGLGAYYGFLRDSGESTASDQTTTTLAATTSSVAVTATSEATTTTEAPVAWTDLNPNGQVPSPRDEPAMVYDSSAGRVILFGGWDDDDDADLGDTWAYDPAANTWTNLNPTGNVPPARSVHSMVYDEAADKVILFGGWDYSAGNSLNDTWAYDPSANTWTNLKPRGTVPSGRYFSSMVYDESQGKVILFGGYDNHDISADDTWVYDFAANTWTELTPAGASPSARVAHRMVYDSTQGKVILFGGYDEGADAYFDDTWIYDSAANTWTELSPAGASPSARSGHCMVYDSAEAELILFGGWDGNLCGDTWAYDPISNTWADLNPAGDVPRARDGHAMVYDPGTGRVILFGGWDEDAGSDLNDTWAYGD
jgi:N-acetylneuraminic acid mutarotase